MAIIPKGVKNCFQLFVPVIAANSAGYAAIKRRLLFVIIYVPIINKECQATINNFREERPAQGAGHKVDGIGVLVVDAW